jgi:homocysteine S-methyltransferase
VSVVGVNCTAPHFVESLLQKLDCPWPKVAYPNSGEGWDGINKKWIPADCHGSASSWDEYAHKWFDAGARVFGGCCRTSPDDIRSIRRHFEQ